MEGAAHLLEDIPRESMLTYAVLFGQQERKRDPYALGAQIADMAVRGNVSIGEIAYNNPDLTLRLTHHNNMLEEEALFMTSLQRHCAPDTAGHIMLSSVASSKAVAGDVKTLWKRVVMMHHTNYNQDSPLYSADPTRLIKWQQSRRTLGWILAVGSVYANPGWEGRLGGIAEVQKGYEEPEFIGYTAAGRALCKKVEHLREHMLRIARTGKPDPRHTNEYERVLPFALLFDDALKDEWPAFLSKHYTRYPA